MDNFIFTDEQYLQLQTEYSKHITPPVDDIIKTLNSLIHEIQISSFQLPLNIQNIIKSNLIKAKQILEIIYKAETPNKPQNNIKSSNPFILIHSLSTLSKYLTSHKLKSPYQLIFLQTNSLIVGCIIEISNYLKNKNIKIFKFIQNN